MKQKSFDKENKNKNPKIKKQIRKGPEDQDDGPRERDRPENKLKLNKFHQRVGKKKASYKKKIRDVERLLAKVKFPR